MSNPDVDGRHVTAEVRRLERRIAGYQGHRLLVAFSGGVDSAVVLALAARSRGISRVTAVTAASPSYPQGELEQAERLARSIGVQHKAVATAEVEKERYAQNTALRCFHCKTELYSVLQEIAAGAEYGTAILSGANGDDAGELRPGLLAAKRYGIHQPLLEERVGKPMVRAIARRLALSVADKPALACLASRVAYGIRVTPQLLRRIDLAEQAVRAMGFPAVRVRHFGALALIEVPAEQVDSLLARSCLSVVTDRLHALGWVSVEVDRQGLHSGSMNRLLPASELRKVTRALRERLPERAVN